MTLYAYTFLGLSDKVLSFSSHTCIAAPPYLPLLFENQFPQILDSDSGLKILNTATKCIIFIYSWQRMAKEHFPPVLWMLQRPRLGFLCLFLGWLAQNLHCDIVWYFRNNKKVHGVEIVLAPYPWQLIEQNDTDVDRSMVMVKELQPLSNRRGGDIKFSLLDWIPDITSYCLTSYECYLGRYWST